MSQYMIHITLPEFIEEDFVSLIPEQRAHVDTLMNQGVITSYSLALDRSRLWVTLVVGNEKEVSKIINAFPIADFIEYEIVELAFHNSASVSFPSMSLN